MPLSIPLGSATPLVESGSGAPGTGGKASHEDHAHPGAFATAAPALTLGTGNSAGAASTAVATDATILAFDATAPSTQAFGDAAAVGDAPTAARRNHKHAMPALHFEIPFVISQDEYSKTDATYNVLWKPVVFDKSKFAGLTGIYFAADLSQDNAGTYTCYVKMFNQSAGNDTNMPELSAAIAQGQHSPQISADIQNYIAAGVNMYTAEVKVQAGGQLTAHNIRMIVRF